MASTVHPAQLATLTGTEAADVSGGEVDGADVDTLLSAGDELDDLAATDRLDEPDPVDMADIERVDRRAATDESAGALTRAVSATADGAVLNPGTVTTGPAGPLGIANTCVAATTDDGPAVELATVQPAEHMNSNPSISANVRHTVRGRVPTVRVAIPLSYTSEPP